MFCLHSIILHSISLSYSLILLTNFSLFSFIYSLNLVFTDSITCSLIVWKRSLISFIISLFTPLNRVFTSLISLLISLNLVLNFSSLLSKRLFMSFSFTFYSSNFVSFTSKRLFILSKFLSLLMLCSVNIACIISNILFSSDFLLWTGIIIDSVLLISMKLFTKLLYKFCPVTIPPPNERFYAEA